MSIFRKIGEKAITAATNNPEKLLDKLDGINTKLQKATGMKCENEALSNNEYKYHLVIKQKTDKLEWDGLFIDAELQWRDSFFVYDSTGNSKYLIRGTNLMGKYHFHVFDKAGTRLGIVKKKLITIPSPFEKDAKEASIEVNGNNSWDLRSYTSFGTREFDCGIKNWSIKCNKAEKEFTILKKGTKQAIISKTISGRKTNHEDQYVLSYNDLTNEVMLLMIVIALDAMLFSQ